VVARKVIPLAVASSWLLVLGAASGCSSAAPPREEVDEGVAVIDSVTAKGEVRALYEASTDLVGGSWVEDTRDWGWCRTPGGANGVQYDLYAFSRGVQLAADPKEIAEQVRALWGKFGHDAKIVHEDIAPHRYILSDPAWLRGSAPNGSLFQFTVGEGYASFSASSACVLGNEAELNSLEPPRSNDQNG
jgi:hypothetical protein